MPTLEARFSRRRAPAYFPAAERRKDAVQISRVRVCPVGCTRVRLFCLCVRPAHGTFIDYRLVWVLDLHFNNCPLIRREELKRKKSVSDFGLILTWVLGGLRTDARSAVAMRSVRQIRSGNPIGADALPPTSTPEIPRQTNNHPKHTTDYLKHPYMHPESPRRLRNQPRASSAWPDCSPCGGIITIQPPQEVV